MNKLTITKFAPNHSPKNLKIADLSTFISDCLVKKSVTIIIGQWDQSSHNIFYPLTNNNFLVQRRFNTADNEVTKYISTHLVMVRQYSDTQRIIVCSCRRYHGNNIPCNIFMLYSMLSQLLFIVVFANKKFKHFIIKMKPQ